MSSLAPFLFNVYINELCNLDLRSPIFLYADDAALVLVSDNIEKVILKCQNDIQTLMNCYGNNFISVNREKTNLMFIRNT